MKASSMGVEFEIRLTKEEISKLEVQTLQGVFNHNEYEDTKRKIPFSLIYSHQNQDQMLINSWPKEYLGNADSICITLFNYDYEKLKGTGYCGDRISNAIMKGFEIYYNFITKHQTLKRCPYELAIPELKEKLNVPNKWLELIELASFSFNNPTNK